MGLPNSDDGVDGFMRLAQEYGAEAVFLMIRAVRVNSSRYGDDIGAQILHQLAAAMVKETETAKNLDHDKARREVALRLGYKPAARGNGGTITNFYKILGHGRTTPAPDTRPSSKYRGSTGAV